LIFSQVLYQLSYPPDLARFSARGVRIIAALLGTVNAAAGYRRFGARPVHPRQLACSPRSR
jgi:hypothetical protein